MAKQRTATPKAPAPTEQLVLHALRLAASSAGTAKWAGKTAKALFNEKEENTPAAVEECTKPGAALLEKVGECGRLTPGGFARTLAGATAAEAAERVLEFAGTLTAPDREALKSALESRTSAPDGELYSAAVNALDAEAERQAGERAAAAARAQLERYRQAVGVKKQAVTRLERDLAFCRKEAAGLEKLVADLEAATPPPEPEVTPLPRDTGGRPEPRPLVPATPEEKDFRRNVARRLVSSWLESIRLNKAEGRRFLEVAVGNIDGLEQIEDEGQRVAFTGAYHRCETGVSTGAPVTVVRPGWRLREDDGEYVIEQALVKP